MEFQTILQNIKKKIIHPIYLLQGEEPYFVDIISDYIEDNLLTEADKGFNQTVFYGKDTAVSTVAESARRYPMMAERQVIIVKEAQTLEKIEELFKYAENPNPTTVLVLAHKYKNLDSRTKLAKAIKKNGLIFTSGKVRDYQLPTWIENFLKEKGFTISPQATQILVAYLGTNLGKVVNELNKLMIASKGGKKITADDIEKNIGVSKDYNLFELQDALGERNVLKANQIVQYFGANEKQNPVQRTIATLFTYFSNIFAVHFIPDKSDFNVSKKLGMHPFVAKKCVAASRKYSATKLYEIIGILREYDMKSKGFDTSTLVSSLDLQKEMIFKILH